MEIKKEIPLGAINGVNKTFTLSNEIGVVDDVFMDGAVYVGFSVSGNQITLSDAPTLSLYVDYSTTTVPIFTDSTATLGMMLDEVWNQLGQKSTSTTFSRDYLVGKINQAMRRVISGHIKSFLSPQTYRSGDLWFMQGTYSVRVKGGSMITTNYAIGDSEIVCDTTNLLGNGYVNISGDIIAYNGISPTGITGVSGATSNHFAQETIQQLYQVPIDFDKPKGLFVNGITSMQIPMDDDGIKAVHYQVVPYQNKKLLVLNGVDADSLVQVQYERKYVDMVDDTEMCILPADSGVVVISSLVAGEEAIMRGLPQAQALLALAYTKLQEMYQTLATKRVIIRQSLKPIPYKHNSIR